MPLKPPVVIIGSGGSGLEIVDFYENRENNQELPKPLSAHCAGQQPAGSISPILVTVMQNDKR